MKIIKDKINEIGYKQYRLAEMFKIDIKTMSRWSNGIGIEEHIKFIEVTDFLNINNKEIIKEYKKTREEKP